MSDVLQCPECELRFRSSSELEQHITFDHPEFKLEGHSIKEAIEAAERREAERRRHHGS